MEDSKQCKACWQDATAAIKCSRDSGPALLRSLLMLKRHLSWDRQMANMLEGGGKTPLLPPAALQELGFSIVAYPLSLLGVSVRAMQRALDLLQARRSGCKSRAWEWRVRFPCIPCSVRWTCSRRAASATKAGFRVWFEQDQGVVCLLCCQRAKTVCLLLCCP